MTAVADAPGPRQGVRRAGTIGSSRGALRADSRLTVWGPASTPSPSSAPNVLGQSQAQGFTGFNTQVHIVFLLCRSGPAVVHLELELKHVAKTS